MKNLGRRIKELRKKNGMTQEKLADHIGVTYQSVSKWENGMTYPDISLVGPLAKILHTSADALLGLSGEEKDKNREKYDDAYRKFRNHGDHGAGYWWAREAVIEYPEDFRYLEWLAFAEYQIAFDEDKKASGNCEFLDEMIENSLRRYEFIIENCTDTHIYTKAVLGKIADLRFTERIEEADWSAEFEYPDITVTSAEQALQLCPEGRELLEYLKSGEHNEGNEDTLKKQHLSEIRGAENQP